MSRLILAASLLPGFLYPCDVSAQDSGVHKVSIWLRAYIPNRHPSLKDYIRKTDNGLTAIEAPWTPHLAGLGLDVKNGTCFLGDNRGLSLAPSASSRVSIKLDLKTDITSMQLVSKSVSVGASHNVDCKTGEELLASRSASASKVAIGEMRSSESSSVMNVRASVSNPFYDGLPGAPAIDFEAIIRFDILEQSIGVKGVTGAFPSFEVFYSVDGGPFKVLLDRPPHEGATAASLFDFNLGINSYNFEGEIPLL